MSVEGEMAANGNGNLRGDDDGEDSTMSGGTASSVRTKAVWLTGENQHTCQHQRSRKNLTCHLGHLSNLQSICMESLGVNSDEEVSKSSQ